MILFAHYRIRLSRYQNHSLRRYDVNPGISHGCQDRSRELRLDQNRDIPVIISVVVVTYLYKLLKELISSLTARTHHKGKESTPTGHTIIMSSNLLV